MPLTEPSVIDVLPEWVLNHLAQARHYEVDVGSYEAELGGTQEYIH